MCHKCDFHRERSVRQKAIAQRADPTVREVHLRLAELHERQLAIFAEVHDRAS